LRDENSGTGSSGLSGQGSASALRAAISETTAPTDARGVAIDEALLCSSAGEVLYQWKCDAIETRLDLFKRLERGALSASKGTPSGRFHRISIDTGNSRLTVLIQPTFKLLVRSALPKMNTNTN
jgi:hypothetical protein